MLADATEDDVVIGRVNSHRKVFRTFSRFLRDVGIKTLKDIPLGLEAWSKNLNHDVVVGGDLNAGRIEAFISQLTEVVGMEVQRPSHLLWLGQKSLCILPYIVPLVVDEELVFEEENAIIQQCMDSKFLVAI